MNINQKPTETWNLEETTVVDPSAVTIITKGKEHNPNSEPGPGDGQNQNKEDQNGEEQKSEPGPGTPGLGTPGLGTPGLGTPGLVIDIVDKGDGKEVLPPKKGKLPPMGGIDSHIYEEPDKGKDEQGGESVWVGPIEQARQQEHERGRDEARSFSSKRAIQDSLTQKLDWRKILKDFITSIANKTKADYNKPNRKYLASKLYTPTRKNLKEAKILVAIDASGSCAHDYTNFIGEIKHMYETLPVDVNVLIDVIWWTTSVGKGPIRFDKNNYEEISKIEDMPIGGTTISCVKYWIEQDIKKRKPEGIIYFTDGFVETDPKVFDAKSLFVLTFDGGNELIKHLKIKTVYIDDGHGGRR
jgi:hypothetical protein